MRKLIVVFWIFYAAGLFGQIQYNAELEIKLAGKTKFQDIKSTVIRHYTEKLSLLSATDSAARKKIMRQLKMWNRKFWIEENYTNAEGVVSNPAKIITQAMEQRRNESPTTNSPQAQSENWVSEGPEYSNKGIGRIDRIAFHPTDPLIIYAGSPQGGLFKTINGGIYWTPVSAFVASLGVSGIAINPTNPDIIYVLSGDGESSDGGFVNNYGYRSASNGTYKTINGGNTWQKLANFPNVTDDTVYQGRQLLMDPVNSNVLYAATSRGLFKTTNGGNNWVSLTGSTVTNIWDVKMKPDNHSVIYITGNNFFGRSINGGAFINTSIPALNITSRVSMAVTPANPNKVLLLAGQNAVAPNTNDNFVGVFTSVDSGGVFTPTFTGTNIFNNFIGQNVISGQVVYNSNIEISRTNQNIVFVGGLVIWKSTDGGSSWNQSTAYWSAGPNYIHPDHHCLKINPLDNKLYNGNDGGVYVSANESTSWEYKSYGLSTSQFYHFEVENDEGNTWGGCQDNGIQQRVTGLQFEVYYGGDGYDVMTDNSYRVADGEGNNVYFTLNTQIFEDDGLGGFNELSIPNNKNYFGNLAMSPLFEDTIYAGYQDSTWISGDAGNHWINLGNMPGNWCVATCPSLQGRLYAAGSKTGFKGIKRLENSNSNWVDLMGDLITKGYKTSLKITDIEVNKQNADSLIISIGGPESDAKVFSTSDAGATWHNITYNLPNVPAFSLKQDETGGIYVGTSIGVYYKRNEIDHWEPFYNGLPPVPVTQIELYANNNRVQISTFGRGLWSTAKYGGCADTLNLTGQVTGRNYWEVSDKITSNQQILNQPGTNIIYSAGNKIKLTPGTHIYKDAKFIGLIQPCGGRVEFIKSGNRK
jgi:photosystem II stability/assembly factor-like uncharacterized protein